MSANTLQRHNIRNATYKKPTRYESRVIRSVAPNQPELTKALDQLSDNTGEVVRYKKAGKLGVTLVMLEPVLRQVLLRNRNGHIPRDVLADFESELNDNLSHAQYADYDVPLSDPDFYPLDLYGKNQQYLGIRLDKRDYRLVGDRAIVEEYIRSTYDVSKRFLDKNLVEMRPHITIGEVNYDNIDGMERDMLQKNPSDFIIRRAHERMEANRKEFGTPDVVEPIIFPEDITLNGLRVFCQQRGNGTL